MTPCHENGRGCIRAFEDGTCGEQGQCSIVLAILAERKRCAKVAESLTPYGHIVGTAVARGIAKKIMEDPACPA